MWSTPDEGVSKVLGAPADVRCLTIVTLDGQAIPVHDVGYWSQVS